MRLHDNRIDFNKNQSVGYSFVNFISATWLLVFVKACRGMLLNHNVLRRHMKPCAASYANLEGYGCLASTHCRGWLLVLVTPAAASYSTPPHHLVDTPTNLHSLAPGLGLRVIRGQVPQLFYPWGG